MQHCYVFKSSKFSIFSDLAAKPCPYPLKITQLNLVLRRHSKVLTWSLSKMAFRSRVSPLLRCSLSAVRTAVTRRTLTSQSKEGASSFRFAGPLLIGASAVTAGLLAANQLYNNNFCLIGNVHAATKVRHLDRYLILFSCWFRFWSAVGCYLLYLTWSAWKSQSNRYLSIL